jgi:photosystem II stability/assembly factor-like uncharacterized protein
LNRFIGLAFILYVVLAAVFAFSPRQGGTPPPPKTGIDQLLMLDGLVLGGRLVVAGERGRIFLSDNGGRDWHPASSPGQATLTALAAVDERRLVAVGHDATILVSRDAGGHWEEVYEDREGGSPLLAVWFGPSGHGIAVGAYGRYLESRDGGASWQARTLEGDEPHLNAIVQAADGRLLIAGEFGTLLRSSDGGQNWDRLDSPYAGSFFGLLATPDAGLLAFGMRGHLYRSGDGGGQWEAIATGTESSLFGGRVLADGRILLVGQNGLVLAQEGPGQAFQHLDPFSRATFSGVLPVAGSTELLLVGEGGVTRIAPGQVTP